MPIIKARPNRVRSVWHLRHLHDPNRGLLMIDAGFIGDCPTTWWINELKQHGDTKTDHIHTERSARGEAACGCPA
jgi:hypothetical protein